MKLAAPQPAAAARRRRRAPLLLPLAAALAGSLAIGSAATQEGRIDYALGSRPVPGLHGDRAALLLAGRDGGDIDAAALALPLPRPEGGGRVTLLAEIDGASLLGREAPTAPRLEIYAYAVTAAGSIAGFLGQEIDLDLERFGEAIYSGGLKFVGGLELPPGSYTVRLLIYEAAGRRYAVRVLPVELEAAEERSGGNRIVAPPLVAQPLGSWLLLGEAPRPESPGSGIAAVLARGDPLPAARPVLAAERTAVVELLVAAPPAGDLAAAAVVTAADGGEVRADAEVVDRAASGLPGLERLRLGIPLTGVAPGRHRLHIEVEAPDGGRWQSPPLEVEVAAAEGAAGRIWAGLDHPLPPPAARGAAIDLPRPGKRRRSAADGRTVATVAAAYRDALARLAGGAEGDARDAVATFEEGVTNQLVEGPGGLLAEGELQLLDRLAQRVPEALVPAMVLHLDLYSRYLDAKNYYLAVHSRGLVAEIAELYARTAATASARILAARALTRLGIALERAHLMARARDLLERAAQLDPADPVCLLALAAGYEKLGDYPQAIVHLRRLVEIDPKSAEGRLRLAINLDRTGDHAAAAALYRRLTAEANPAWVLSLAYQQLARGHLDGGRPDAAARLLTAAVDRLPGDERLRIALAFALDRTGDRAAARRAVDRLGVADGRPGESARWLYNEWSDEGVAEAAELLDRNARARLGALATALEAISKDGGG